MSAPQLFYNREKHHSFDNNIDHFAIDDLLDLPDEDNQEQDANINVVVGGGNNVNVNGNSSNTSSGCDHISKDVQFSSELLVPQDDLADLEWLSTFQEDSFSREELQTLQIISGFGPQSSNSSNHTAIQLKQNQNSSAIQLQQNVIHHKNGSTPIFDTPVQIPAKARSKRRRLAPCDFRSRVFSVADVPQPAQDVVFSAQPPQPHTPIKRATKRRDNGDNGEGRKCLHCATDKTPQWRTGPLGPKTLCNACGVRYKSGRLVPEYRPAASPTFVQTKHSNSHRKVMELRRQNEMKAQSQHMQHQHLQHQLFLHEQHQDMTFDMSSTEDYLINQHMGVDFGGLI